MRQTSLKTLILSSLGFINHPSKSYFPFAPRGTRKSTFIRAQYLEAIWIDFLLPDIERRYRTVPARFMELLQGQPKKSL
jgi:hypothetical protein